MMPAIADAQSGGNILSNVAQGHVLAESHLPWTATNIFVRWGFQLVALETKEAAGIGRRNRQLLLQRRVF